MADFGGTELETFRTEVRDWISANFPASLKGKANPMMREERTRKPGARPWARRAGACPPGRRNMAAAG